jgi:hypothetical protein
VAFPDTVALYIAHLTPIVAPVKVATRVPRQRPDEFVQVRRVGGIPLQPVRDVARLDVFCWADTDPKAWALAAAVRDATWALAGTNLLGPVVYDVSEFLGPRQADETDSDKPAPRVWTTFELAVRADDVIHRAP